MFITDLQWNSTIKYFLSERNVRHESCERGKKCAHPLRPKEALFHEDSPLGLGEQSHEIAPRDFTSFCRRYRSHSQRSFFFQKSFDFYLTDRRE